VTRRFDPFKEHKDRKAHERGLEHKELHKMVRLGVKASVRTRLMHCKPKPVTLAPTPFKDR
jgi:hypothetical protein